jgi:hypothetical protein
MPDWFWGEKEQRHFVSTPRQADRYRMVEKHQLSKIDQTGSMLTSESQHHLGPLSDVLNGARALKIPTFASSRLLLRTLSPREPLRVERQVGLEVYASG